MSDELRAVAATAAELSRVLRELAGLVRRMADQVAATGPALRRPAPTAERLADCVRELVAEAIDSTAYTTADPPAPPLPPPGVDF